MLLQKNIVKKYLALLNEEQTLTVWNQYQSYFLNEDIQQNIQQSKEEQFQEGFLRELFVKVLERRRMRRIRRRLMALFRKMAR